MKERRAGAVLPYLDEVLVDPFGEGFLLHPVTLICKEENKEGGSAQSRGVGKPAVTHRHNGKEMVKRLSQPVPGPMPSPPPVPGRACLQAPPSPDRGAGVSQHTSLQAQELPGLPRVQPAPGREPSPRPAARADSDSGLLRLQGLREGGRCRTPEKG